MAIEVRVPRLGWNMEQGVFVAWHKKDGEAVRAGEALFVLEGDKATQDVEATDAGILHIPADAPKEGDTVAVGALLGYLVTAESVGQASSLPGQEAGKMAAPRPRAVSPRARRVAKALGVDCAGLKGSGRTGRIRERDVRAAARHDATTPGQAVTATRRAIAEKLLTSLRSTAPVTLTTTADATNLVNLREQFKAADQSVPGYTDVLVKLAAVALKAHPLLNARWDEGRIVMQEGVHVGIAVDTEAGLLVPVVRDVASLSLREVAARSRDLVERARARRLTADEMRGGTFTVSNLGAFGVDAFTPIINYPECAILGVGRIRRQPAVVDDRVVPRDAVTLSLTFDHRIVDGAPAARFLDALRGCVENPGPWLIA